MSPILRYVGVFEIGVLALLVGACSNVAQEPVKVSVVLGASSHSTTLAASAFGTKSTSGLVVSGFCYLFNVTAPDLNDPSVEVKTDTCGHGPKAKGKIFGPFAYGKSAIMTLPPGPSRVFDLLGFKIPEGTDAACEGVFEVSILPGATESHVKLTYDGVEIDPQVAEGEMPDPLESLYLFSRSSPVTLVSGNQSVALKAIEWSDRTLDGVTASYPKRYDCTNYSQAELVFTPTSLDFGSSVSTLVTDTLTLTNNGSVVATSIDFGSTSFGSGMDFTGGSFPGTNGDCGAELAGGASCTLEVEFDPSLSTPGATVSGTLEANYYDGSQDTAATALMTATGALVLTVDAARAFSSITSGDSVVQTVTLVNNSAAAISGLGGAIVNTAGAAFSFDGGAGFPGTGGNCTTGLAVGASCTVTVKFSPITAGTFGGHINFTFVGGSSAMTMLSGNGI